MRAALPLNRFDWFVRANARALGVPAAEFPDFLADARSTSAEALVAEIRASLAFEVPPGLDRVATPVLVVAGDGETRAVRRSMAELTAAIPRAQGWIAEDGNHLWNLRHPRRFSAMVRAWLTGQPLPAGLHRG